MSKTLVAYFSAESGSTKALAETLAMVTGADKFEIVPAKPYSKVDLNYSNPLARCNREQIAKKDVPIADRIGRATVVEHFPKQETSSTVSTRFWIGVWYM